MSTPTRNAPDWHRELAAKLRRDAPKLRGRITYHNPQRHLQVVETDSREEYKRVVHLIGPTYLKGAVVGNKVELTYKVEYNNGVPFGVWTGSRID